jgi:ferredoxin
VNRLRVDWIKCDGFGLCGDYAPEFIDLDEWRYPIVRPDPIDDADLNEVQRAVDCCPMKALSLESMSAEAGGRSRRGLRSPARSAGAVRG